MAAVFTAERGEAVLLVGEKKLEYWVDSERVFSPSLSLRRLGFGVDCCCSSSTIASSSFFWTPRLPPSCLNVSGPMAWTRLISPRLAIF